MTDPTFRAGFVTVFGWTNVGKSTLINHYAGMRLAIVSSIPQTTRNRTLCVVNQPNSQIVLVDTPGIHNPHKKLSEIMIRASWETTDSADAVIWMTIPDVSPELQLSLVEERFHHLRVPLIVAINKIDASPKQLLLPLMDLFHKALNPKAIIPISALKGENTDELITTVASVLPEGEPMYSEDVITDRTERFMASEIIRLHVMHSTFDEVPHSVAVEIEKFDQYEEEQKLNISAALHIEKDSQKGILIGKGGEKIKKIGITSRLDLEDYFGMRVNLKLWVRVSKDWRNSLRFLNELGISKS